MTVIETTYAGTGGVLIGTGARWLLLAAEPSPGDVEALWSLLTRPGPAVDAVVDLLEKQHPRGLPSLALLDLSSDGGGQRDPRVRADHPRRRRPAAHAGQRGRSPGAPARRRGRDGRLRARAAGDAARARARSGADPGARSRAAHRRRPGAHPRRDRTRARPRRRVDGRARWTPRPGRRSPTTRSAVPRRRTPTTPRRRPPSSRRSRRPRDPDHDGHTSRPAPAADDAATTVRSVGRATCATRRARRCWPCAARPAT